MNTKPSVSIGASCARSASALFMAIAIVTLMTMLAVVGLATARQNRDASGGQTQARLARLAAQAGTDHAIAVLRDEYLRTPGVPTNRSQRWRRAFDAIDAASPNISSVDDDAGGWGPAGGRRQMYRHPTNLDQDDVRYQDGLWNPLLSFGETAYFDPIPANDDDGTYGINVGSSGNFNGRNKLAHQFGLTTGDGISRWYEPGYFDPAPGAALDTPAKMIAFDAADSPLTSFDDTRIYRSGAGSASDTPSTSDQEPMCYDAAWQPLRPEPGETWADVRRNARYRIRYAVAIEDLSGYLTVTQQGHYNPSAQWGDGAGSTEPTLSGFPSFWSVAGDEIEDFLTQNITLGVSTDGARRNDSNAMLATSYPGLAQSNTTGPPAYEHKRSVLAGYHPYAWSAGNLMTGLWLSSVDALNIFDGRGSSAGAWSDPMSDATLSNHMAGFSGGGNYTNSSAGTTNNQKAYSRDGRWITISSSGTPNTYRNHNGVIASPEMAHALLVDAALGPNTRMAPFVITPFGRLGTASDLEPETGASPSSVKPDRVSDTTAWDYSPTRSPWRINVLTAPPATVRAMIWGYLPPEAKTVWMQHDLGPLQWDASARTVKDPAAWTPQPSYLYTLSTFTRGMVQLFNGPIGEDSNGNGVIDDDAATGRGPFNSMLKEDRFKSDGTAGSDGKLCPDGYAKYDDFTAAGTALSAQPDPGTVTDPATGVAIVQAPVSYPPALDALSPALAVLGKRHWQVNDGRNIDLQNDQNSITDPAENRPWQQIASLDPHTRPFDPLLGQDASYLMQWPYMGERRSDEDTDGNGTINTNDIRHRYRPFTGSDGATRLYYLANFIPMTNAVHGSGWTYTDSYFLDLAVAMARTVQVMQYAWAHPQPDHWLMPGQSWTFPAGTECGTPAFANGRANAPPADFDSIMEMDRLFVNNTGERFLAANRTAAPAPVLTTVGSGWGAPGGHSLTTRTPSGLSIKGVNDAAASDATATAMNRARANQMELVLNDMRMSFFGANPAYAAEFRPKDFSGDGLVYCSAYGWGKSCPSFINTAHPDWASLNTAGMYAACDDGDGPPLMFDTINGDGIADTRWDTNRDTVIDSRDGPQSVTGYFTMQKSHYYRMMVRGEVWDQLKRTTVSQANLETVYAVDPGGVGPLTVNTPPPTGAAKWSQRANNGPSLNATVSTNFSASNADRGAGGPPAARLGLEESAILFQKWHRNKYQMTRPKTYP